MPAATAEAREGEGLFINGIRIYRKLRKIKTKKRK